MNQLVETAAQQLEEVVYKRKVLRTIILAFLREDSQRVCEGEDLPHKKLHRYASTDLTDKRLVELVRKYNT